MSTVKVGGASRTGSPPWGSDPGDVVRAASAVEPEGPAAQPVRPSAPTAATASTRRRRSAAAVGLAAHDMECLVELDVDLPAVVEGDLDLVVALLVADLGAGHPAPSGRRQRGVARLLQRLPADRDIGTLGRVRSAGCRRDPGAA